MRKLITSVGCIFIGVVFAIDMTQLPVAKVTLHVVGENGGNLSGAKAEITFLNPVHKPGTWGSSDTFSRSGKTDANGLFVAEEKAGFEVHYGASAPNYYRSLGRFDFKTEKAGKYLPWNPTFEVVLKKIINPIPMYARRAQVETPVSDQPVGFDLVESDWVAPYGKGKLSDFIFTLQRRFDSRRNYESIVTLSFSNQGDGLHAVEAPAEYGSELKLPHTAPDTGYAPQKVCRIGAAPGRSNYEDVQTSRNYLFRVRTIFDERGQPASGLYGKIDGDIRLDSINSKTCILLFTYYLNPTPNDRNLEFDPKRNLSTNLKDEERVTAP